MAPQVERRVSAIVGSAIFLFLAPGIVAGYIPWRISGWHIQAPQLGMAWLRGAGILLMAASIPVLLDSFVRFALQGLGTPAPVFPTRHLVVSGLFRYVRNPMYVAVLSLIFGQALLFGSLATLEYGAVVWLAFFLFVFLYEEPTCMKSLRSSEPLAPNMRNSAATCRAGSLEFAPGAGPIQ